ncbi:MAG: archease [Thermoguttaceae bacterium]
MFEIFEHTADVGIRARAETPEGLFADAARGLFSVMVSHLDVVRPVETVELRVPGDNLEELLHDWLSELLFIFSTRRLVFCEFQVQIGSDGLTASVRGEPLDPRRHALDVEVKAITWHALKVERTADGWVAEVIVDV